MSRGDNIFFAIAAAFLLGLIIIASGCEHGALIPIDPLPPTCAEQVDAITNECVPDAQDEFCLLCVDRYTEGYTDCQEELQCPEPPTVYLCKTRVRVCPQTFCRTWGGDCCHYVNEWVECDGPE